MTFRNNYLAVLTATLLLFSFCAQAQIRIGERQKNLSKGIDFKELTADSLFRLPKDTLSLLRKDSGSLAYKGGVVWVFNGKPDNCNCQRWDTASGKGGGGGKIYKESFGIKITGPSIDSIKLDTSALPILNVTRSIRKVNDSTIQLENDLSAPPDDSKWLYGFKDSARGFVKVTDYDVSATAIALRAKIAATVTGDLLPSSINNLPSQWYYDAADVTSPDDGVMILVTGGKRLKRYVDNFINAKWFGAKGNNSDDDGPALQAAIDWVIAHPSYTRTLYIPRGVYRIGNPLIVYKWDGSNYTAASIEIIGENVASFTAGEYNTIILPTFNNTFALGIQRGKSVKIRGLYFQGVATGNSIFFPSGGSYAAFVQRPFATYMGGLCRDSRYSPYAGIVIDPFNTGLPADGGYPGLSAYYRGSPGGSSEIYIGDCRMDGFTVGVAMGIAGSANNTESIIIERPTFGYMKVCIAVGHDQAKANFVRNPIVWDWVHTFADNQTFGFSYGTMPYFQGGNFAFRVNRMFNYYDAGRYALHAENIFAEGLFQIGQILGVQTSQVRACTFDFATHPINPNTPSPDYYMVTGNVLFTECAFRIYEGLPTRLAISPYNTVFDNCSFPELPVSRLVSEYGGQKVSYRDCHLDLAGNTVAGMTGSLVTQINNGDIGNVLGPNFKFTNSTGFNYTSLVTEVQDPYSEAYLSLGSYTVTIDSATATGSFTVSSTRAKMIQVGDMISDGDAKLFIKVSAVDTTTGVITLTQAPISMRTGFKPLYLDYVRRFTGSFTGNTVAGSRVITNVNTRYTLLPDQRMESNLFGDVDVNAGYTQGGIIRAVDNAAHTITMNLPAAFTKTGVHFENPIKVSRTIFSRFNPTDNNEYVDKGTVWVFKNDLAGAAIDKKYIFYKGGYTVPSAGWQQQAAWYVERPTRDSANVYQWYDMDDDTWKNAGSGSSGGGGGGGMGKIASATANQVPKIVNDSVLTNSQISDDGTIVKIGTGTPFSGSQVMIGNSSAGINLDLSGNDYSRIFMRDPSAPTDKKIIEMLNDGGVFSFSRLNDANTVRTPKFTVSDDGVGINKTGGSSTGIALEAAGIIYSNTGGFKFPDGSVQTQAGTVGGITGSGSSGYVPVFSSGSAVTTGLIRDAGGYVGINQAPNAPYMLGVTGDIGATGQISSIGTGSGFNIGNRSTGTGAWQLGSYDSNQDLQAYDLTGGGFKFRFSRSGGKFKYEAHPGLAGDNQALPDVQYVDSADAAITASRPLILSGSATLDFPSTAAHETSGLTITVTGAATGDAVAVGSDASTLTGHIYTATVSGSNTVTVIFLNGSGSTYDPGSATFKVRVIK